MKFKVGDKVSYEGPSYLSRRGLVGIITAVRGGNSYVPYDVTYDDYPYSPWLYAESELKLAPVFQGAPQVYPDNNPKTLVGAAKVPLHLVPPSAKYYLAQALKNGAEKYGAYNWRDAAISVSTYKAAMERHMDAFWDGEDLAEDSGVHHVAHAMACAALILDAMSIDKLVDDRPTKGASSRLQQEWLSGL